MKTKSFSSVGPSFLVMDALATERQGPIQDRTRKHLGYSDKVIAQQRKLLLQAIRKVQEGGEAPHVAHTPEANRFAYLGALPVVIPKSKVWRNIWKEYDLVP